MNNEQLTPRITPTLITSYPDQLAHILNRFIEDFYDGNGGGGSGNLERIEQTTTSYDDGGVNVITAYLSDGTTSEFQIRNGTKGSQGNPGPAGQDGQDGAPGADGFSPIATVTKSGDTATITITDSLGTTTATISDGQDGADGAPGADGQSATIAVGNTSTLTPGSSATVTNSGTSSAAVFDFGIPKGEKGDTGATGPANSLSIGTVTSGATASATITGTPPNQTLSLVLPKGDPGTTANVVNAYSASTTDAYSASYINNAIPTVNNATLTIQKNGTSVGTFTANSSTNATANITVPTSFSDLTGTIGTSQIDDAAITNAKIDWSTIAYSSTEQVVGKWTDNKIIYRQIFQYTLSGSSWNTVGTINGIGDVIRIYGAYKRPNGIQTEYPRSTMETYIDTNGTIHVRDTEGNDGTVKCIVEYTKSN